MTAPTKKRLVHRYVPSGAAKELFARKDSEVLLSGPAGTGKSLACLQKMHLLALINPDFRGVILRKTATSLASSALVTFKKVTEAATDAGDVYWHGGSAKDPGQYRYKNGATITIGGMDRSTRVMSSEYDVAYVQEATELTEADWDAITTRLRNNALSFQQLIADCNPDTPTHWLKARCDRGVTVMLESRHRDNPTLFTEDGAKTAKGAEYLAKLDNLTGVRRLRLRDGQWAAAEGMIYDDFDAAVHVIDAPEDWPTAKAPGRRQPPKDWPRYWTVDFGYVNPFVCQRWAVSPDGALYLYAEHYKTKTLVEEHAANMLGSVTAGTVNASGEQHWKEPRPVRIICDHDAEDRATLEKHLGMPTHPAKKTVSDGIQATAARFKLGGNGRPRIYFVRGAVAHPDPELRNSKKPTSTLEEIPGYVWREAGTNLTSKQHDEPLKRDDHGMDAMRYLVADLDLGGEYRLRWLDTR